MSYKHLSPMHSGEVLVLANVLIHFYPQMLIDAGEKRIARGAALARMSVLYHEEYPGCYDVESQTDPRIKYTVNPKMHSCSCPDSARGNLCKHRIAVAIHIVAPGLHNKLIADRTIDADERNAITKGRYLPYDKTQYEVCIIPHLEEDPANVS